MKYRKFFLVMAFVLVAFLAFYHFAVANCGTCGVDKPECTGNCPEGSECPDCAGKTTCDGNCPEGSECPDCAGKTPCDGDKPECGGNCPEGSECPDCAGKTKCEGAKMMDVTLTGKFICSECVVSMTEMVVSGEEMPPMDEAAITAMKQGAVDNMKNGAAILFMDSEGKIYTCTFNSESVPTREDVMEATMKDEVKVAGVLYCMGGQKVLKVNSIE